ncbi:MAG: phosphatase PAP2 family protein [Acidimicrobiales bacterium]
MLLHHGSAGDAAGQPPPGDLVRPERGAEEGPDCGPGPAGAGVELLPAGGRGQWWVEVRAFLRRRPTLWIEAAVLVWLLWLYDDIDNLSPVRLHAALSHARAVLALEDMAGIDPERWLNHAVAAHPLVALVISDFYDNAHFVVTLGLLGLVWARHHQHYRRLRNQLVIVNLVGFAVFWAWPMAPPRMLPGFYDLVTSTHAIGSWHAGSLGAQANQLAAMPSLHMAWAVWSGVALWTIGRRRVVTVLAVAYPILTFLGVLITANHFVVDSVAGVATALGAAPVGRLWDDLCARLAGDRPAWARRIGRVRSAGQIGRGG